ncbi:DUF1361 domain-containing protein [Chitinophaga sedimenti]|uniref:DUF1361 domain-containing protein n=1 Tax=Chitinophaga sedimenti TaxID=2033606 RepID=UPI0020053FFC|nr:DUF1361 domain-containing protein [Chitinophaga sedimenti]MCK7558978.1 DUF1361 domain-containing protein [Chitinophaga sedimenti]
MKLLTVRTGVTQLLTRKYTLTHMAYLATLFCLFLVAVRMRYTGTTAYAFMIWNLFLGYVPFILSNAMAVVKPLVQRWWLLLPMLGLWIIFLPNAPYMITDLFHLEPFGAVPQWFDLFLLCSFAFTGVLIGYLSMAQVKGLLQQRFEARLRGFNLPVIWLCAAGVYVGRFYAGIPWICLPVLRLYSVIFSALFFNHLITPVHGDLLFAWVAL